MKTGPVRTKDNTDLMKWRKLALAAFAARGLPTPSYTAVSDAYEVGESPETWADYVAFADASAADAEAALEEYLSERS